MNINSVKYIVSIFWCARPIFWNKITILMINIRYIIHFLFYALLMCSSIFCVFFSEDVQAFTLYCSLKILKWITSVVNKNRTHLSFFEWQASANSFWTSFSCVHRRNMKKIPSSTMHFIPIPFLYLSKDCQKYSVHSKNRKKWNTLTYDEEWN